MVGAGYSMSRETGDAATVVKLMRVAMLLPVILCAALITRAQGKEAGGQRPPILPGFALAFFVLACVNSTGWVPAAVQQLGYAGRYHSSLYYKPAAWRPWLAALPRGWRSRRLLMPEK